MGCGKSKSKQDVATGNTIVTAPKNSFSNNDEESNKSVEALLEKSTIVIEEILENVNQGDGHETDKVASIQENIVTLDDQEQEPIESAVVIDRVDDVVTNVVVVEEEQEEEMIESSDRLISRDSPNTFFSSRKDEETVGSIVSEKESQTNVESVTTDGDNVVKEDEAVEIVALETPIAVDEEKDVIITEKVIESAQSKN